jgi:hypothetical protein
VPAPLTRLRVLVQRGRQLGAAETPRRTTSSSPEDTVRVDIATSVLASWRLAASGSNLKATVRGDSTAHRPGSCLRVNPLVGPMATGPGRREVRPLDRVIAFIVGSSEG